MSCTFTVLDSAGTDYVIPVDVLDSAGASYTLPVNVLDSAGVAYTIGVCTTATTDTTANSGGGGRKKKLPFYEGYKESRTVVDDTPKKKTDYAGKPLIKPPKEVKKEVVEAKGVTVGELMAKMPLPVIEKPAETVNPYDKDIESAIVILLLKGK